MSDEPTEGHYTAAVFLVVAGAVYSALEILRRLEGLAALWAAPPLLLALLVVCATKPKE